jgi:CRP-like cAMP-binding protein
LLQPLSLTAGDVIMEQGEEDTTLAFITSGAASVQVGDVRIGGAGARDVLGLVELFTGMPRVASVVASGPVQLLVLAPEAWMQLCERGHPAVYNIERAAIRRLGDRLRWFNQGIAERSRGEELKLHPSKGLFARISKSLRGKAAPDVDAAAVLQQSSLFSWAPGPVLQQISESFTAERFDAEHILCRQDEDADRMWIVAEGHVDVVLLTGADRAEKLATLGAGEAFGDATMAMGTARSASCVSHEEGIALVLERDRYLELFAVDDEAGSVFRQGMVRNLVRQLLAAQGRFVELAGAEVVQEDMIRGTPISTVWRD